MTRFVCADLSAGYSGADVVRDLSFEVDAGSVLAVLGPNGAGKTTVMLALAGLHPWSSGSVAVDGHQIRSGRPRAAAQSGIVLVPDDRALFKSLTVLENLQLASVGSTQTDEVLDLFPALRERTTLLAGLLSGGEQQMLAVSRGLVQRPKVLLIDELSMGLAPVVVHQLLPVIRRLADEVGTTVLLVEQHVSLALEVADSVVVLANGSVVLSGTAAEMRADPSRLQAAYLGGPP